MTTRHFLAITYQGTHYHGWQRQHDVPSIQATLEDTMARLRVPVSLYGSSRTDKGVHAKQQIAHADLPSDVDVALLQHRLNRLLPQDIYVQRIQSVPPTAHARFDALGRTYTYHMITTPNPFLTATAYHCPYPLDMARMNEAATFLLGEQNFKSFCKAHANVPHHRCYITHAGWHRQDDQWRFFIHANRFLHGMVRAIVGTLVEVGRGRLTPEAMPDIIAQQDRCAAKSAAPPQGLFLTQVAYPPHIYR